MPNRPSRLNVSIPTASSDGRFYGRYPHGDKPSSGAVGLLEDAEGTMRVLGGHNLWDNYSGEGAAASTSFTAAAARFGAQGLRYTITAGFAYMHFFGNDGATWAFAHEKLLSGTPWTKSVFNRLRFWVKSSILQPQSGANRHSIEIGTYTRSQAGDPATQNAGGTHYYHYIDPKPGVWTKVIIDNHPQHAVGGPTSDSGIITSPTSDGPSWNYHDALTRFYYNATDIPTTSYPANFDFDQFEFYNDSNAEDIANMATLEASYNASTHLLHLGFVRNSLGDTTYTVKWSLSDMFVNGFASGTTLGTVGVDGLGDYVNKFVDGTVDLTGQPLVYLAVQKLGQTGFRQMTLELT
jgi:hypothetical protein